MKEKKLNILKWFSILLFERYKVDFVVGQTKGSNIKISLKNSKRLIILPNIYNAFLIHNNEEMPCSKFDLSNSIIKPKIGNFIPAPGISKVDTILIHNVKEGIKINYDIVGLTFWMLSRSEEVGRNDLDQFGRFPAKSSHAFKNNYLNRPIVDEWIDVLEQVFILIWPDLKLIKESFKTVVTHDVDRPSRYLFCSNGLYFKKVVKDLIKDRYLINAIKSPFIRFEKRKIHPWDPYNTFKWIMDMSEKYSIKSTFYFMTGVTDKSKDSDYKIDHPSIVLLLKEIYNRGHNIGIHPSFNTYKNEEILKSEVNKLERVCSINGIKLGKIKSRMHYLRWETPTTLDILSNAGVWQDSTLGYSDLPGFRCGTCFSYPSISPCAQRIGAIRIEPLIYMDVSGFRGEAGLDKLLKKRCEIFDGTFSILWHNNYLHRDKHRKQYLDLICYAK